MGIRCLSLMEPWASLVALGHKRIETRGWPTGYRGPLAIHASRSTECLKNGFPDKLCLRANLIHRFGPDYPWPLGKILCIAYLHECLATHRISVPVDPREIALGDFSFTRERMRYAWILGQPARLPEPVPHRGALSLWEPDPKVQTFLREFWEKRQAEVGATTA